MFRLRGCKRDVMEFLDCPAPSTGKLKRPVSNKPVRQVPSCKYQLTCTTHFLKEICRPFTWWYEIDDTVSRSAPVPRGIHGIVGDLNVGVVVLRNFGPVTHLEDNGHSEPAEGSLPSSRALRNVADCFPSLPKLQAVPLANIGVAKLCLEQLSVHLPSFTVREEGQGLAPSHSTE